MRNTIRNRVINFVNDIDIRVWITVLVIVLGLWVVVNAATGFSNVLKEIERDRNARQEVYTEAIEEVRECDIVEKIIRPKSVTYTYSCDGVEYQFDEWL